MYDFSRAKARKKTINEEDPSQNAGNKMSIVGWFISIYFRSLGNVISCCLAPKCLILHFTLC